MSDGKFYGKYRGTVVQNIDPEFRARIMCIVPDVLGLVPSSWCEVSAPLAGPTGLPMGAYMVPPIGAGVWVEFEQGDPGKPIWSGCRFGVGDIPPLALAGLPVSPNIVLQTAGQNTLMISDTPAKIQYREIQGSVGGTTRLSASNNILLTSGRPRLFTR